MTRLTVHEYAAALRHRYRAARKGGKGKMLDEFCQTTGMHRKAAIRLLAKPSRPRLVGRGRPRRYGSEVAQALVQLWEVGDRMCGKLLAAVVPDLLAALERHGELKMSPEVRGLLLQASPSTIDRLLRRHRTSGLRQPKRQRPATTSLKSQVPIRTWSEWQGVPAGSIQADLVLHCGETVEGFFLTTLCAVDVASGWTELQPVWGMGKQRVGTAMHLIRQRLPFPLKTLHTDNGSEFINHVLVPWCLRENITPHPRPRLPQERPGLCGAAELAQRPPSGRLPAVELPRRLQPPPRTLPAPEAADELLPASSQAGRQGAPGGQGSQTLR